MNLDSNEICLNDGLKIPKIGLGTYRLNGSAGAAAMKNAINLGYRLLDSAFNYENEGALGAAVRACSVPREALILCSKLPGRRQQYNQVLETVEESLFRAGLDYYDLYLIHWPNPKTDLYVEAWQGLIDAKKRGLVRSIGVCNFLPEHLERLVAETGITPSINQVELHPYFNQERQRCANERLGVVTQSWMPVGRAGSLLTEPAILELAARHGKTPPQVILRWHLQLGAVPIPKAASEAHQRENLDIFDFSLSETEMQAIAALGSKGRIRSELDPAEHEEF